MIVDVLVSDEIDRVEKFVQPSEMRTLNARTKHYVIHNYYTMVL